MNVIVPCDWRLGSYVSCEYLFISTDGLQVDDDTYFLLIANQIYAF